MKLISKIKEPRNLFLVFTLLSLIFGSLIFIENSYTEHLWTFGVKNITLFQYFLFLSYVFGLLNWKNKLKQLTEESKELLMGIFSFLGMAAGYEVINSTLYWFLSASSKKLPLDTIKLIEGYKTEYIASKSSIFGNFTHIFVNKMFFLILAVSLFTVFFIYTISKKEI